MFDSTLDPADEVLAADGLWATESAATPLMIATDRPLFREGIGALVGQDRRFNARYLPTRGSQGDSLPEARRPSNEVALIDGLQNQSLLSVVDRMPNVLGGVLLTSAGGPGSPIGGGASAGLGLDPRFRVHTYQSTWEAVARSLLVLAGRGLDSPAGGEAGPEAGPEAGSIGASVLHEGASLGGQTEYDRYRALSPREREVLGGLGDGLTPSEIADQLGIALSTAENHKSRLMKKLDIHRISHLVRFALRVGAASL